MYNQALTIKEKKDKLYYVKIKNFSSLKNTIKGVKKKQITQWKKIFLIDILEALIQNM